MPDVLNISRFRPRPGTDAAKMEQLPSPLSGKKVKSHDLAISDQAFAAFAVLADFCTILTVTVITSGLYLHLVYGSFARPDTYATFAILLAAMYIPLQIAKGQYATETILADGRNVPSIFTSWNYAFLTLLIMSFLVKGTGAFSRAAVALIYVAGFGALLALREGMFHLARHGFRYGILLGKPTMLIGDKVALRATVGGGLIWNSPFGPLRFDVAYAVKKKHYDKDELVQFGIGTKF